VPDAPGQFPAATAAESQIAVVGMACRFPGAPDLAAFWQSLLRGADAIAPGTGTRLGRRPGGYLDDVEWFDAEFFGVPAPEAAAMDPQQRVLHELCWHALEDAGLASRTVGSVRASSPALPRADATGPVGVFVGCCSDEYAMLSRMAPGTGPYTATGTWRAFLANRLSYTFGFTGPSLVLDTGQSSSLVAVHQAVTSLRRGECAVAVAAGVQLNLTEAGDRVHEELGTLSPDGRCYTFDARANGIVRGEGAAVIILKPLKAALANGDRVYCTVLGSAQNNDGGGPGLTLPSETAQRDLLLQAYQEADVRPDLVHYVELHGTGTSGGDPVEAHALGAVCGARRRTDAPLLVGSVKTNIGHLEGAAGIAGLIKTAASLFHRELPATLNHRTPNPDIDLDALRLRVCTGRQGWPDTGGQLIAGVSSFGLGGTNCHVVLCEAPEVPGLGPAPARPLYQFRRRRYWLDALPGSASAAPETRLAQWPADRGAQEALVAEETLRLLGEPPDGDLDPQLPFSSLGLDSRMSVALRGTLARLTGRPLPATLLFDYPTPAALVEALGSPAPL
jgi:acyl transferase domain-containing protein